MYSPDSVVHRRAVTKPLHSPLAGAQRRLFGEDVIELGNGKVVQMHIDDFGERGAPEGQEDPPQPCETPPSKRSSVLKSEKPKSPSLYMNGLNVDLKSQQIVFNKIRLEMEKRDWNNIRSKRLDVGTSQLINAIKKDLTLMTEETIYKVSREHFGLVNSILLTCIIRRFISGLQNVKYWRNTSNYSYYK